MKKLIYASKYNNYDYPDKDSVVYWLEEHDTAYNDCCRHLGVDDLFEADYDDILDWIYEHRILSEDFEYNFSL